MSLLLGAVVGIAATVVVVSRDTGDAGAESASPRGWVGSEFDDGRQHHVVLTDGGVTAGGLALLEGVDEVTPLGDGVSFAVVGAYDPARLAEVAGVLRVYADELVEPLQVAATPGGGQWHLDSDDALPIDVDVPEAWASSDGTGVVVAVIDAGFDLDHPDLVDQWWVNDGEICDNGRDDDGNGYVDDCNGWDFGRKAPNDGVGRRSGDHATSVAGVIAAATGGTDVVGVAPGAEIMALNVGNGSSLPRSQAVEAINYAVANGADIINISWAVSGPTAPLQIAIANALAQDVVVVAAAGNDGRDTDRRALYPAAFDGVLGVAANDQALERAEFSNYGNRTVDLFAPGVSIATTVDGGVGEVTGTSIAAPVVAGVAALVRSAHPDLTGPQVADVLLRTAELHDSFSGLSVAAGQVDADGAVGFLPLDRDDAGPGDDGTGDDAGPGDDGSGDDAGPGDDGTGDDAGPGDDGTGDDAPSGPAGTDMVFRDFDTPQPEAVSGTIITTSDLVGDRSVAYRITVAEMDESDQQPYAIAGMLVPVVHDGVASVQETGEDGTVTIPLDDDAVERLAGGGDAVTALPPLPAGLWAVMIEVVDVDSAERLGNAEAVVFRVGDPLSEPPPVPPALDEPGPDTPGVDAPPSDGEDGIPVDDGLGDLPGVGDQPGSDDGQDAPSGDDSTGESPAGDSPTGDAPAQDGPGGDAPSGDGPASDAPAEDGTGDAPSGDAPAGDDGSGDGPSSEEGDDAPSGEEPTTEEDVPGDAPDEEQTTGEDPASEDGTGDAPADDEPGDATDRVDEDLPPEAQVPEEPFLVTYVDPTVGPLSGGNQVEIRGMALPEDAVVEFGGVEAEVVANGAPYSLTVIAPPSADGGVVSIKITGTGGSVRLPSAYLYLASEAPVDQAPTGDDSPNEGSDGEAPGTDSPSGDAPSGDAPSGDAPNDSDAPSGDAPNDSPSGDAPSGDAPSGDAPNDGDAPGDEATDEDDAPSWRRVPLADDHELRSIGPWDEHANDEKVFDGIVVNTLGT